MNRMIVPIMNMQAVETEIGDNLKMFYLYRIDDSDGNDNTVFDCIIQADSKEQADDKVFNFLDKEAEAEDWEADGDRGYYYPNEGGITVSEPEEFQTEAEALSNCAPYHSRYVIPEAE